LTPEALSLDECVSLPLAQLLFTCQRALT